MYDALAQAFRLRCPVTGVLALHRLSAVRSVERVPGCSRPPVHRVAFDCAQCGAEHPALLSEHDLDCGVVAPGAAGVYFDLMTSAMRGLDADLRELAAFAIQRGSWPWTFYCVREQATRPALPSQIERLEVGGPGAGVAIRCAACGWLSINLCSLRHVDEPFYNDPILHFAPRPVDDQLTVERFRDVLWSTRFDSERNDLAA